MLKLDRFSCSQKIWLKQDPPVYCMATLAPGDNDSRDYYTRRCIYRWVLVKPYSG